jgi:hypothetical protein
MSSRKAWKPRSSHAYHIMRRMPHRIEVDDLIQAGMLGLLEAAQRYECRAGSIFSAYATRRICGRILDSLRRSDWGRIHCAGDCGISMTPSCVLSREPVRRRSRTLSPSHSAWPWALILAPRSISVLHV